MQNAECKMQDAKLPRSASLHSQGMNLNAECKMQNAEWASLHFIPFTWFYLSLIDFVVWMQYEAKSSQQEEFTSGK